MKKLLSLLCGVFVLVAASCGGSDEPNETVTSQTFPGLFAVVNDHASATTAYYTDLNYKLDLNYSNLTASLTITGLKLPDGSAYPTFKLTGLKWNLQSNGWKVIRGSQITPSISGVANAPTFTSVEVRLFDRFVNDGFQNVYSPGVCFSYVIGSKYSVVSSFSPQQLFGTTESVAAGSTDKFTTEATSYQVKLNTETRTVSLTINNARFASAMKNGLNINLNNIPVTFIGTKAVFETASIIPTLGTDNTPMEGFPITNLRGEMDFADDFELQFDCTPRTAPGAYHVTADCDYDDEPSEY